MLSVGAREWVRLAREPDELGNVERRDNISCEDHIGEAVVLILEILMTAKLLCASKHDLCYRAVW